VRVFEFCQSMSSHALAARRGFWAELRGRSPHLPKGKRIRVVYEDWLSRVGVPGGLRCTGCLRQWPKRTAFQNKGAIAPGYDADLILVNFAVYRPVLKEDLQTKCGWSPVKGWNLTGWPTRPIVESQLTYEQGIHSDVRAPCRNPTGRVISSRWLH
jgi:hypothetical protein